MEDFLLTALLGKTLWMWVVFTGIVGLLLAFDLGVLHRKRFLSQIKKLRCSAVSNNP